MGVAETTPIWLGGGRPAGLEVADPPPSQMGVAGRPMWPKGVARPPQQFYFIFYFLFFKQKSLK
jgi:hypothetical protein